MSADGAQGRCCCALRDLLMCLQPLDVQGLWFKERVQHGHWSFIKDDGRSQGRWRLLFKDVLLNIWMVELLFSNLSL
ncbi:hypothetical protein Mgra_00005925 [Meloidogyne graminicola]|uniref:Uncharacterized protein n=1 Tax=Meloidogyne graminicola TaxID=189291 RepID=A0A8S9ZMH5_9BILA|nr:hypothetical protein Mgra_00005925 [Meloidogyne graminicola]